MSVLTLPTPVLPFASLMLLGLLASGMNDQEIADRYQLRRDKIGTEFRRMMTSLDVGSRDAAVAWAYRHGHLMPVPATPPEAPLSERTTRGLWLLVAGQGPRKTADELGLSARGLDTLYLRARLLLDARTRPHLVRRALDTGTVRLTPRGPGC